MFRSFLILDSYLNVIFTSLIGVLIIKVISLFTSPLDFISNFRQPDEKILDLVDMSTNFSWFMFICILLGYFVVGKNFLKKD